MTPVSIVVLQLCFLIVAVLLLLFAMGMRKKK